MFDRPEENGPILVIEDLSIRHAETATPLVKDVSLSLRAGETLALVGESGSGKSLTAAAVCGLLPSGLIAGGSISLDDHELVGASKRTLRHIRGRVATLVLQDPFTSLNPLKTVGSILTEMMERRRFPSRALRRSEAARRLEEVGIGDPRVLRRYPFQLSGGMSQRVALAAALVGEPDVLICDEVTTALDVTTQREVLRLLREIQEARGMALVFITHDLRIAFDTCDRIAVMAGGEIVEQLDSEVKPRIRDPYTAALLSSVLEDGDHASQDYEYPQADSVQPPILAMNAITKRYGENIALNGIDLSVRAGECLAVVGESGSGKTTLSRVLLGLTRADAGHILVDGLDLSDYRQLTPAQRQTARASVQCVFQDPYTSLNPAKSVGATLQEVLRVAHREEETSAEDLLELVGMPRDWAHRMPGSLSGGQRQRIAIARALAMKPKVLVCDEPTSALDATVQAQILALLRRLQHEEQLTILFITHDLSVVRHMADQVLVLYRGEAVESGSTARVLNAPEHEYTQRLLNSVPDSQALHAYREVAVAGAQALAGGAPATG